MLVLLEALRIYLFTNFHSIVVEDDSLNVISWMSCLEKGQWRFQFLFNDIKTWSSSLNVEFHHVLRSENGTADALAKLGIERENIACSFVICCFVLLPAVALLVATHFS